MCQLGTLRGVIPAGHRLCALLGPSGSSSPAIIGPIIIRIQRPTRRRDSVRRVVYIIYIYTHCVFYRRPAQSANYY